MTSLNFHAKEKKINWDIINKGIKEMEWKNICENADTLEMTVLLLEMLEKLCMENIPKKNNEGKNRGISKEVKKLLNRIKMLKRNKHKAHSKEKKMIIENKISEAEKELPSNTLSEPYPFQVFNEAIEYNRYSQVLSSE